MQAKLIASNIKTISPKEKPYEVVDVEIKGFLLRVQPSGRMTYYYSYRQSGGSRKRIKIGVHGSEVTCQQARDQAKVYAGQVARGVDVQKEKADERTRVQGEKLRTLGHFIENQYKPWVLVNRKTGQETLDRVAHCFDRFMGLPLEEITPRRVDKWRMEARKGGQKASTINRSVVALRGIISKALEWGVISSHPLEKLKPLQTDKSPKVRYLTEEEEAALLEALASRDARLKEARESGNRHRAERGYPLLPCLSDQAYADHLSPLVILSIKTGMRRGEAFDLAWGDVDFDQKTITVLGDTAKSGHTRHIPLSPEAFRVLEAWGEQAESQDGRVFPAKDGGRLDNVRKAWAGLLKDAGISSFRWHDLRHHFASKLVMKGVPLNTVRELCGHAELNTTLRYAHLAPEHKAEAVARLD